MTGKAQMVRRAHDMRAAGATWENMKHTLGVSQSTLHRLLTAKQCVDCDAFITPAATRCHACQSVFAPPTGKAAWTKQAIRQAIVAFYSNHGRPPTATEWLHGTPSHPSLSQIRHAYGQFNDAVKDAGLTPRRVGGWKDRPHVDRHLPLRLAPTVTNGFAPEEELAYLIAEQAKDARWGDRIYSYSLDGNDYRTSHSYSDAWTWAVCVIVDYRRLIDLYGSAYRRAA